MTSKNDNGRYVCQFCGDAFEYEQKAENHEELCGVSSLDEFVDDVENVSYFDADLDNDVADSTQLKLGESARAECPRCGNIILEQDVYNQPKQVYECSKCENLVRITREDEVRSYV